jgi:SAM-dependent methyltransferase
MTTPAPQSPREDVPPAPPYTVGYSAPVVKALQDRTAASHAAFFVPHLKAGMRLLDCGCGPGSITMDLAVIIAPGEAVGVDISEGQVAQADLSARQRQVPNLRFQTADILSGYFSSTAFADRTIELGLMRRARLDRDIAAWPAWGCHPDAFWARTWCEVVGSCRP